ncbi:MAG: PIN domain-containing protein [Candidatus Diapherotrites archaeon]
MYAETDFFLALIKKEDRLKRKAEEIYEKYRKQIWTSVLSLQELMLYFHREKLEAVSLIEKLINLVEIKPLNLTKEDCLTASYLAKKYNLTPFDSLHAVISQGDTIISSDAVYDKIGLKRIKLEE